MQLQAPKPSDSIAPMSKKGKEREGGFTMHFAELDPGNWGWGLSMTEQEHLEIKMLLYDPEEFLNRWHQNFQFKRKEKDVSRSLANEIAREWRQLLKQWGALTWAERKVKLIEKMQWHITLFQILGLWEKIEGKLTTKVRDEIHQVLSQDRTIRRDHTSTVGFTVFASELAMAIDKVSEI